VSRWLNVVNVPRFQVLGRLHGSMCQGIVCVPLADSRSHKLALWLHGALYVEQRTIMQGVASAQLAWPS
jgi:hypothetical protein